MVRNDLNDHIVHLAAISEVHDRELAYVRKLRDGDADEPSLPVLLERIANRLKDIEDSKAESKEWKKLVLTTIITTIIASVVTYLFTLRIH